MNPLKQITLLEGEINSFLDDIERSALTFFAGIKYYLNNDEERFRKKIEDIQFIERNSDQLRRAIRYKLYSQMLLPEARGDVLGLLETSDDVVDSAKMILLQFDYEKPVIKAHFKDMFLELADFSVKSVFEMVKASRAYFVNLNMVEEYINMVHFYEHEADLLEAKLKKEIFSSDYFDNLCEKIYARDLVEKIVSLSDEAESICERISVYAIKRRI